MLRHDPSTVALGQWAQIAATWDSSNQFVNFYINGIYNSTVYVGASGKLQDTTSGTNADLLLGNLCDNQAVGAYIFDGSLKQVAFYDRMLSIQEIDANFFQTALATNASYPSLLYYKFTETNQNTGPAYFADTSLEGTSVGTYLTDTNNDVPWTNNQVGIPHAAIHFHGEITCIDTSNSVDLNFTTNLFTVNFWTRPDAGNKVIFDNNRVGTNGFGTNGWSIQIGASFNIVLYNSGDEVSTPSSAISTNWNMVTDIRNKSNQAHIYKRSIYLIRAIRRYNFKPPFVANWRWGDRRHYEQ